MSMHPNARIGIDDGIAAEARIIESYNNGESGDYTVDVMRAVSENDVVFGGYFNHDGRGHMPDGYVQVGRTMHIFEMKDGKRYNEKYIGQVNRYAHVMNIAMDFDEVVTYIIYGSREEVDVEVNRAEDIHLVYAATRLADDKAYSWKVDAEASMTDADRAARSVRDKARWDNRTPEEVESNANKQKIATAKRMAKRSPEQVENDKEKGRLAMANRRLNFTEAEWIKERERGRISCSNARAKLTPEQRAANNAKQNIVKANRSQAQTDRANEMDRKRTANRTPEQKARDSVRNRKAKAKRTPEQRERAKEMERKRLANRSPEKIEADRASARRRQAAIKSKRTPEKIEADRKRKREYEKKRLAKVAQQQSSSRVDADVNYHANF